MTQLVRPFVFGHPRSGTSLLTAILDRHSRLSMMPETHILRALRDITDPIGHERLLVLAWYRLRTRLADLHFLPDQVLEQFRLHPSTPEGLLQALLILWAGRAGKPTAGEKTPGHLACAERVLKGIAGSRAVVIVRDGRAVIEAMRRTAMHSETPLDRLVEGWIQSARLGVELLEKHPGCARLVRFEDLVSDPRTTLARLLDWLGLEFEPTILEPRPTTTFRRWEEFAKQDVAGPIMPWKAEAWRNAEGLLSPEQVERLGEWLVRFGYEHTLLVNASVHEPPAPAPPHPPRSTARPPILIIGGHRTGTATLHEWLGSHPEVAAGHARSYPRFVLDWPLTREELLTAMAAEMETQPEDGQVWCHTASYYLVHPDLPHRVRALLPEARIIVLLRDPVSRAYSHWLHSWRLGVEPLDFDRAIEAEASRLGHSEEELARDESAVRFNHIHYSYALQSRYATHLRRWMSALSREQFLLLTLNELESDAEDSWQRITAHAGIRASAVPELPKAQSLVWPLSIHAVETTRGAMLIREHARADALALQELLQRPLPWLGELPASMLKVLPR